MSRDRHVEVEQPHHERAFEFYSGLGEKRRYSAVADEFGVALSTVKLWGKSFKWQERIRERDLAVARETATRTIDEQATRRERNLQIVRMALVQLAKAVADGRVKMTVGDLDKLIRLESFLKDEPDSRHELVLPDLSQKSPEELRRMVRDEVAALRALATPPLDS